MKLLSPVRYQRVLGIVYLDFSTAFDTVSLEVLKEKMMKYGLGEQTKDCAAIQRHLNRLEKWKKKGTS